MQEDRAPGWRRSAAEQEDGRRQQRRLDKHLTLNHFNLETLIKLSIYYSNSLKYLKFNHNNLNHLTNFIYISRGFTANLFVSSRAFQLQLAGDFVDDTIGIVFLCSIDSIAQIEHVFLLDS